MGAVPHTPGGGGTTPAGGKAAAMAPPSSRTLLYLGLLAVLGACLIMASVHVAIKGISLPENRLRPQQLLEADIALLQRPTGAEPAAPAPAAPASSQPAAADSGDRGSKPLYVGQGICEQRPELDGRAVGALLPRVRGWTNKTAPTNKIEWTVANVDARTTAFIDWRAARAERRGKGAPLQRTLSCGGADEPGLAFPQCHIMINDRYRYIYIRTPKAGSTSVVDALGECGNNRTRGWRQRHPSCMRLITDVDPAIWKDYFVFGFVRNPWRRAYSLYKYLQSDSTLLSSHMKDGVVSPQCKSNWGDFCSSPWEEAERLHRAECFYRTRPYIYYHFNSQHRCFRTAEGEWATDFIGGLDGHANEDWRTILTEINRRRLPEFPEIPLADLEETNVKPSTVKDPFGGDNAHCLDAVTNWFACDADTFRFWPANKSSSNSSTSGSSSNSSDSGSPAASPGPAASSPSEGGAGQGQEEAGDAEVRRSGNRRRLHAGA